MRNDVACCGNCKHWAPVAWWVSEDGTHCPCSWVCTRNEYYSSKDFTEVCEKFEKEEMNNA